MLNLNPSKRLWQEWRLLSSIHSNDASSLQCHVHFRFSLEILFYFLEIRIIKCSVLGNLTSYQGREQLEEADNGWLWQAGMLQSLLFFVYGYALCSLHHTFQRPFKWKLYPPANKTCKMSDTLLFDSFFLSFGISNLNHLKQVSVSTYPDSHSGFSLLSPGLHWGVR